MYVPKDYQLENSEEIHAFLRQYGFAVLVNQTRGKLWATHIPLLLDFDVQGHPILLGHISKMNPQSEGFAENEDVLAVFTGPHHYISSSWYDHENVPTWNYMAVHVYGKVRVLTHEDALESLSKLVDHYEKDSEKPVRVADLSEKTMREARGIIAFSIEITAIEGQKKLSQNRDTKNYQNIITTLEKLDDNQALALAKLMKANRK